MPHFPRCERTQHKIIMAESGSQKTLAASCTNVRFRAVLGKDSYLILNTGSKWHSTSYLRQQNRCVSIKCSRQDHKFGNVNAPLPRFNPSHKRLVAVQQCRKFCLSYTFGFPRLDQSVDESDMAF